MWKFQSSDEKKPSVVKPTKKAPSKPPKKAVPKQRTEVSRSDIVEAVREDILFYTKLSLTAVTVSAILVMIGVTLFAISSINRVTNTNQISVEKQVKVP